MKRILLPMVTAVALVLGGFWTSTAQADHWHYGHQGYYPGYHCSPGYGYGGYGGYQPYYHSFRPHRGHHGHGYYSGHRHHFSTRPSFSIHFGF